MFIEKSESSTKVLSAFAKANAEVGQAYKGSANPFHKNSYAGLPEVIDAYSGAYKSHGLTISQSPEFKDGLCILHTVILHESGEFLVLVPSSIPLAKCDPQGMGSAVSYLRRYSQMAMANLKTTDDDGEAAQGRDQKSVKDKRTGADVNPPEARGVKAQAQHGKGFEDGIADIKKQLRLNVKAMQMAESMAELTKTKDDAKSFIKRNSRFIDSVAETNELGKVFTSLYRAMEEREASNA